MYLAEIADSSIVTISLPWIIWTTIGGAIVASFAWLARLSIKALNENRASINSMHAEVVTLTREVVGSMTDNTSALREIAKSNDALASYVLHVKQYPLGDDEDEPPKEEGKSDA